MFVVQVAATKGRGGIITAMQHYERLFRRHGISSVCVYRGPGRDKLLAEGAEVIEAPLSLMSPLGGYLPILGSLGRSLKLKARRQNTLVIVHSDMALKAMRRLLPRATFVAPCHSAKTKRKGDADLVITLNAEQQSAASFALRASNARVALLGNPYVSALAEQALPAQPDRDSRIVFCARLIPTKDPLVLVRAMAEIPLARRPELLIIGDGPLRSSVEANSERLGVRTSFAGWVNDPLRTLSRSDILVLPSHWEGLPYLLQEALDAGLPIIAADNAGNRHALGGGAYGDLFPVGDYLALAASLLQALADPEVLRRKAELGRSALHKTYGAEAFWTAFMGELKMVRDAEFSHIGETRVQPAQVQ